MKKFLLLVLASTSLIAQERKQIQGTLSNDFNEPVEGIMVFNTTTLEGTVTNTNGVFYMDVRNGDNLSFSALQFDPFELKITQAIVDKGTAELTLSEGINMLEEVVVMDQTVRVAVKRTQIPDIGIDKVSRRNMDVPAVDRIENTFSDLRRQPEEMPLNNAALNQSQLRYNGVDIVGLLIALVAKAILGNNNNLTIELPSMQKERFQKVLLKNQYSTEYLIDFLNIPEENLYEFMVYAQEEGLNENMLKSENEFQLLQFLDDKAIVYKARITRTEKSTVEETVKQ
jgi:hypothetical protein